MNTTINYDAGQRVSIFGKSDRHLKYLSNKLRIKIVINKNQINIHGENETTVKKAHNVIQELVNISKQQNITKSIIDSILDSIELKKIPNSLTNFNGTIIPKTDGQSEYIKNILTKELIFCVGPAGTGKTYLAVAAAVSFIKNHQFDRILLVRPAIEAGEKLGYLPGDINEKLNPYMIPFFDALMDMMSPDLLNKFINNKIIEIAPIGFMRGRTFNNCIVVMDEAQNSTKEQMLMFLTRMGQNCKMIVTGDTSQVDIDVKRQSSGLIDATKRLDKIDKIAITYLKQEDIVRNQLVEAIITAYQNNNLGV